MSAEEQTVAAADKVPKPKKDPRYSKVGGWLGLFCFGLTFAVPGVYFTNFLTELKSLSPLFQIYPRLRIVFWVNTALQLGIGIFSLVAGGMLLKLKKNAPKVARMFLLALFGQAVFYAISYLLAGMPAAFNRAFGAGVALQLVRQGLTSGAWYVYLLESKRVKWTYGDAADAPTVPAEPATAQPAPAGDVRPLRTVACPQCRVSEEIPYDKIYEPGQYTKFGASVKRSFGFLNLKLTCRSCGKEFKYEGNP